jgi:predicted DNA-binding antitoxin AbrB/MazE fold protein
MNESIPAVFLEGVFRPLGPVDLAEGTEVAIPLPRASETVSGELSPERLAKQQQAIADLIAEIESLPHEGPDDGFSGRDHDKILYDRP